MTIELNKKEFFIIRDALYVYERQEYKELSQAAAECYRSNSCSNIEMMQRALNRKNDIIELKKRFENYGNEHETV